MRSSCASQLWKRLLQLVCRSLPSRLPRTAHRECSELRGKCRAALSRTSGRAVLRVYGRVAAVYVHTDVLRGPMVFVHCDIECS